MKKRISILLLLVVLLLLPGCKKTDDPTVSGKIPDNPLPVLTNTVSDIVLGQERSLLISNYTNYEAFDITIDHPDIISIDEYYYIKALKIGKATISVTLKQEVICTSNIVIEVLSEEPLIYTASPILQIGTIAKLHVRNLDKLVETSLDDFHWSVDNQTVITLNDDHTITGKAYGKAMITATSKQNSKITSTYLVAVADGANTLILDGANTSGEIATGEQVKLKLVGNRNPLDYTWITDDKKIAMVTENGMVTTIGEGYVTIVAYLKTNPLEKALFTLHVSGIPNVDYVARLLNIALNEKGYVEGPNNDSKYGKWYGLNYEPWCAMFVSWCWNQAGLSTDILLKYCGCQAGMDWCVSQGIFKYKKEYQPKSGDIIFFLSSGMSHTGICVYADDEYMYTIEGNSSNMVNVWRWSLKDARITGYATPNYPTHTGPTTDFSWIAGNDENGSSHWTNVSEKQETT